MKFKTILFLLIVCSYLQTHAQTDPFPIHLQTVNSNKPIVVFLTGDGGWNTFSIQLANEIAKNGYPTISLDTRKYFWEQKTPVIFANDMNTILNKYLKQWNKDEFYIVGYSFGAEVAAFLPNRLPLATLQKLKSLVLLSPGYSNSFEVRYINMLFSKNTNKDQYKVYPELLKTKVPVWCIFGAEEQTDISQQLKETNNIRKVNIPGDHHYDDDVKGVTRGLMKGLIN